MENMSDEYRTDETDIVSCSQEQNDLIWQAQSYGASPQNT
jgi:hypothetical protein